MNPLFALLCACPPEAEPQGISQLTCPEDFGQIQKAILQRTYSDGTTYNEITPANAILAASWEALVDANDSTKAVFTNTLGDPQGTPGAPITFGSGNQVPNGAPVNRGTEPTAMSFVMYSHTQVIIKEMKGWKCETASVFFINQDGQIAGQIDDPANPAQFRGFPIIANTMHVGDKQFGGYAEPDRNAWHFSLQPNWSDNFFVITPQFDALAGLYE